ncbi:hypothetical protein SNE40_015887 [Patella caerulea]|uniref:Uncharacterized protein n=1 Tax=Patella caerulea TaxID=87958 RepID=A0AAN8JAV6_PATCE
MATKKKFQDEHWSIKDLKDLKEVLNTVPIDDIAKIKKKFPFKTESQIKDLITKCRTYEFREKLPSLEAPIESWTGLAARLVYHDDIDHSENLSRAMSLISEYEDRTPVDCELKVDYKLIYRYLADILIGKASVTPLPALECTIILDLMHSLADVLKEKNTEIHQKIMQWKYKLLTCKIDLYNKQHQTDQFRKALFNDFSDLLNPEKTSESPNRKTGLGKKRKRNETVDMKSLAKICKATSSAQDNSEESVKDSPSKNRDQQPLVKPKLFTINPLCIPVALVKLKDLKS